MKTDTTRCNSGYKFDRFRFKMDIGKNWLTSRVVNVRNTMRHLLYTKPIEGFTWRLNNLKDRERSW